MNRHCVLVFVSVLCGAHTVLPALDLSAYEHDQDIPVVSGRGSIGSDQDQNGEIILTRREQKKQQRRFNRLLKAQQVAATGLGGNVAAALRGAHVQQDTDESDSHSDSSSSLDSFADVIDLAGHISGAGALSTSAPSSPARVASVGVLAKSHNDAFIASLPDSTGPDGYFTPVGKSRASSIIGDSTADTSSITAIHGSPKFNSTHAQASASDASNEIARLEQIVVDALERQNAHTNQDGSANGRSPFEESTESQHDSDNESKKSASPKAHSRSGSGSSAEFRITSVKRDGRPATASSSDARRAKDNSSPARSSSVTNLTELGRIPNQGDGDKSLKPARRNSGSTHTSDEDNAEEKAPLLGGRSRSRSEGSAPKALATKAISGSGSLPRRSSVELRDLSIPSSLEDSGAGVGLSADKGGFAVPSPVVPPKPGRVPGLDDMDAGSSKDKPKTNSFFTKKFTLAALFGAGLGTVGYIAYRIFVEANENDDDGADTLL